MKDIMVNKGVLLRAFPNHAILRVIKSYIKNTGDLKFSHKQAFGETIYTNSELVNLILRKVKCCPLKSKKVTPESLIAL